MKGASRGYSGGMSGFCAERVQRRKGWGERKNRKGIVYRKWADKEKRYWRCKRKKKARDIRFLYRKRINRSGAEKRNWVDF